MTNLVIRCHKRDGTLSLELRSDLAMHRLLVGFHCQQEVGPLFLEGLKNGFMVCARGVAGLADRHTRSGRIQRDLGNECGAPAGLGLDPTPQCLILTHQLIEIRCAIWDLGDRPVTDRGAQG
jgi:hypothetical protein